MTDALCRQVDPDLHYPERGCHVQQRMAKECCTRCPVQLDCLTYALRIEQGLTLQYRYGIWGSLTPLERAALDAGVSAA